MTNEKLNQALIERNSYLEKHPHLKEFQKKIDDILDKTSDESQRLEVLVLLMAGKMTELRDNVLLLNGLLSKTINV